MNGAAGDLHSGIENRLVDLGAEKALAAESRNERRVDVDHVALVVARNLDQSQKPGQDDEVGPAVADRVEDGRAEFGRRMRWLARDRGRPAASALGIAPIRGRLATTWTISARNRRARIRSIRYCSIIPPPETHTASRIGGLVIGGLRGVKSMVPDLPGVRRVRQV